MFSVSFFEELEEVAPPTASETLRTLTVGSGGGEKEISMKVKSHKKE